MRLLVDMNISPAVVALLHAAGHEVFRVGEVLDARATDDAILAKWVARGDGVLGPA